MPSPTSEEEVPNCTVPAQLSVVGVGSVGSVGLVGADVVTPTPESVVVCSSSMTPQLTTSDAAAMMASKIHITVPLFAGLDYLAHVCLRNKV